MEKTYFIETFGCQMNVYDSEFIADLLSMRGYSEAPTAGDASLVIVNTCSVRARAERKAITRVQELAALRRSGAKRRLGIVGCMAQRMGRDLEEAGCRVDFILGPDTYLNLPRVIDVPRVTAVTALQSCLLELCAHRTVAQQCPLRQRFE